MKRITISLPDDLAEALGREARRRHESVSAVVRQALRAHLTPQRRPGIVALGRSGHAHTARDAERLLAEGWARARDR
jgi:metal-responsive CopG/Arc/MetJ family transcriptional regulator